MAMANVGDLISRGRSQEVWDKFCGFLDLDMPGFMAIQERLLLEQLHLFSSSQLGRTLMRDRAPTTTAEFRQVVPLTEYADYEPYLSEKRVEVLPREPYLWARTSGRSGAAKWAPYTEQGYAKMGERIMAAVILAAATERGDLRLAPGDVLVYNTPPRPYSSGVALVSLAEIFPFHFVPPLDMTEEMSFQQRMEWSFQTALVTGIDVIGSITSVLVKIGERFAQGAGGGRLSRQALHPKALLRMVRALIRSKLARRPLLPRDIWQPKAVMAGGSDTALYREKIMYYWGVKPHEQYSSTETLGTAAVQAWDKKGLYFFPDAVCWEFIPEAEWMKNRDDPTYQPQTVLLDQVEVGQRYEVVVTSFDGGPFLRYRMHDLVRFISLTDVENGIKLPSMIFAGRSDGLIDLAGFTGAMDEPMIAQSVHETGIAYADWAARKESGRDGAFVHLYIELRDGATAQDVRSGVADNLRRLNPFYADLENMLEVRPLQVTLLAKGTYQAYFMEKQAQGADLAHLKPARMNPSDDVIATLLRLSRAAAA